MPTAAQSPAVTELSILKAIAEHYWDFFDWPDRTELVEALGPIYGLSSLVASLKAKRWIEIGTCGSQTYIAMRLPDGRRNWLDQYDEVTAFGRFLAHEQVYTGEQLQDYYEKPWQWHSEYAAYLVASERLESV